MTNFSIDKLILGKSPAIRRAREIVAKVAPMTFSVLIQGPTGSGKRLIGEVIHRLSGRSGPLVTVDPSKVADRDFFPKFFGYSPEAVGDSDPPFQGLFREADRGTLYLEHVEALPEKRQLILRRALDTKEFCQIGDVRMVTSDFRLITALDPALTGCQDGEWIRDEFYYRVSDIIIDVPSLLDRLEDLPLLTQHFVMRIAANQGKAPPDIERDARKALIEHDWPGNVRELQYVLEHAVGAALLEWRPVSGRDILDALDASARQWRMPDLGPGWMEALQFPPGRIRFLK